MAQGLDADNTLTDYAGALLNAGYIWVGRYINPGKAEPLTHAEASHLNTMGLFVVSIWEEGSPTHIGYFTTDRGTEDGTGAVSAAQSIGQPAGTPIYFAVDYDAAESDLTQIGEYFIALHSIVRNANYFVGVYSSGLVCQYLSNIGYVSQTWLSQSKGFAGYSTWLPNANIVQGIETTFDGLDVDLDSSNNDAGGWKIAAS